MKESNTQEPVGGMKWVKASEIVPEKIGYYNARNGTAKVPCILHFGFDGKYRNEEGDAVVNIDLYEWLDENYTPPPAPTDGEDEKATAFADSKERRGCSYWQGLYNGFKAGYSDSLPQSSTGGLPKLDQPILDDDDVKEIIGPQSSTEEEKELWKTALNFFQGEYILKPFTTKEEIISELMSTYKISKR